MDFVHDIIETNSIVIFSKKHCYKCDVLKQFLTSETIDFYNCIVDDMDCEDKIFEVIDTLKTLTNFKQYPVCFIEKEYIHSLDEIKKRCYINKEVDIDNI